MQYTFPSAPQFNTRVPIQFLVPDNPSLNIAGANSLLNNMSIFEITSGNMGKIDTGLDGLNYYRGDDEYAPMQLLIEWKSLGYNDFLKLSALRPYYVNFISFRNLGYYGKLVPGGPKSGQSKTADIVSMQAMFYTLSPSDAGGAVAVSRMASPPSYTVASNGDSSGYIISNAMTYYFLTFRTKYGETLPYSDGLNHGTTSTTGNISNRISWAWPSTTSYCLGATLYVANTNNPAAAIKLADIENGMTPTWVDYVGIAGTTIRQFAPTVNTAYRGSWNAGIWVNEIP